MTPEKRVQKFPDLGSASDWSLPSEKFASTNQIWEVTRHQYGISALVSQTLFRGESDGGLANFSGQEDRIKARLNHCIRGSNAAFKWA